MLIPQLEGAGSQAGPERDGVTPGHRQFLLQSVLVLYFLPVPVMLRHPSASAMLMGHPHHVPRHPGSLWWLRGTVLL